MADRWPALGHLQRQYRDLPAIDVRAWEAERRADDDVFGADDPLAQEPRV